MSRLNRLMWTGLALGVAACGDDVTVQPPAPPPVSVVVTPDGATIQVGGTLQMSAAVSGGEGGAPTIAWSSSNNATATVSGTGLVTGVAAGAVGITATATVGTSSGAGSATVTVSSVPTTQPPTVSIASITNTIIGTGEVPVNLAAVAGQINVKLNVERNNNPIQRVELVMQTAAGADTVVASQGFSSSAPVEAGPALVPEEILLSVNTATFNATTGAVAFPNGPNSVSARLIGSSGSPAANQSQNITLANVNTFISNVTLAGTTATAIGATNGLQYSRGGLEISVIPVIYSPGLNLAFGFVNFGAAGAVCDASGIGTRTVGLTAPAAGSNAWTATLAQTGTPGVGNVNAYEFSTLIGTCPNAVAAVGERPTLTGTDQNGNSLFIGSVAAAGTPGIRLDNRAPGAPTFVANPVNRQNGWINGGVGLTGVNGTAAFPGVASATDHDWLLNPAAAVGGTADAGVGGFTRWLRVAASTPGGSVAAAIAAEASMTPALPAPSLNATSYCAVSSGRDLLGNESALPAAATVCNAPVVASFTATGLNHQQFGVDIAAPTIAFSGGLASNDSLNGGTVGAEFQVTVADTGTVGNSGMLSGAAVIGTVQIRSAALTPPSAGSCFVGAFAAGACNPVSVNAAPAFPLVPTTTVAASATTGYYTYSAVSQDAAGNQSGAVSRVIAYDAAANVPALTQALFNVPLNGPSVVFNANSSDNFDLRWVQYALTYAGGLAGPIVYPIVTLSAYNSTPLTNSNVAAGITIDGFVRQIENVTGNAPLTVGGAFKPVNLAGQAKDHANNLSAVANTGIPGASVTNGVSYTAAAAAQLINSWSITAPAAAVNISNGAGPAAPVNPTSVAINVDAFGPTATFNAPFTRVDFYLLVGGNLVQIGSTTSFGTVDDGSAFGRRHRYSFTWTPGPGVAVGVATIYAIGVNGVGDGLVTPLNANITITNP